VQDGVSPSADMDYEAIGGDVGCMGIYTPVGFPTEVKLGEPNYDFWWRRITPGESDLTGGIFLGLIPWMIIDSAETPALQVTIISANFEPCTASRIKDRISPCIKVNFNGVWGDGINIGIDTDAGGIVDVQRCNTDREVGIGSQLNLRRILHLRWKAVANLLCIEGIASRVLEHVGAWRWTSHPWRYLLDLVRSYRSYSLVTDLCCL